MLDKIIETRTIYVPFHKIISISSVNKQKKTPHNSVLSALFPIPQKSSRPKRSLPLVLELESIIQCTETEVGFCPKCTYFSPPVCIWRGLEAQKIISRTSHKCECRVADVAKREKGSRAIVWPPGAIYLVAVTTVCNLYPFPHAGRMLMGDHSLYWQRWEKLNNK